MPRWRRLPAGRLARPRQPQAAATTTMRYCPRRGRTTSADSAAVDPMGWPSQMVICDCVGVAVVGGPVPVGGGRTQRALAHLARLHKGTSTAPGEGTVTTMFDLSRCRNSFVTYTVDD